MQYLYKEFTPIISHDDWILEVF